MIRAAESPVARHATRLTSGRYWLLGVVAVLATSVIGGLLMQRYWLELAEYRLLAPASLHRIIGMTLLAEALLLFPWAVHRGAQLWHVTERYGLLDEYRRTRLPAPGILFGLYSAAARPALLAVVVSLGVAIVVSGVPDGPGLGAMAGAHAVLLCLSLAGVGIGLGLRSLLRSMTVAIPVAMLLFTLAVTAIKLVDPLLRQSPNPTFLIETALAPNPVTAVGSALGTDVLRFGWIYQQVHAHEYFFVYPPVWLTCGLYLLVGALAVTVATRRLARREV